MTDIQVIVPTRIGAVGANLLNQSLQQTLNPPAPGKDEFELAGRKFRTGDKVMQIKNNYDILWKRDNGEEGLGVYNGDIGFVEQIDRPSMTGWRNISLRCPPSWNLAMPSPSTKVRAASLKRWSCL